MSSFLFYTHKMLQLVLLILHDTLNLDYRQIVCLFSEADLASYPTLNKVKIAMWDSARKQQKGVPDCLGESLVFSPVDGVYLMPDLTLQIQLGMEGQLDQFFQETADYLGRFVFQQDAQYPMDVLRETLIMNRRLFYKMYAIQGFPLNQANAQTVVQPQLLRFQYNLPDYFQARLQGKRIPLQRLAQVLEKHI